MRTEQSIPLDRASQALYDGFIGTIGNANTRRQYGYSILSMHSFVGKPLLLINKDDYLGYVSQLNIARDHDELSESTYRIRLYALKAFGKYVAETVPGYVSCFEDVPIPVGNRSVNILSMPSLSQCDLVLEKAQTQRDLELMFLFALRSCFTSSVIIHMKQSDFYLKNDYLFVKDGSPLKNRMPDAVIPSDIKDRVLAYLDGIDDGAFLFTTARGRQYSRATLGRKVKDFLSPLGLGMYSLADFRNRGITEMMAAGVKPCDVASYLGRTERRIRSYQLAGDICANQAPCEYSRIRIKE